MVAFIAALYAISDLRSRVDRIAQSRQTIIDSTERVRAEFFQTSCAPSSKMA